MAIVRASSVSENASSARKQLHCFIEKARMLDAVVLPHCSISNEFHEGALLNITAVPTRVTSVNMYLRFLVFHDIYRNCFQCSACGSFVSELHSSVGVENRRTFYCAQCDRATVAPLCVSAEFDIEVANQQAKLVVSPMALYGMCKLNKICALWEANVIAEKDRSSVEASLNSLCGHPVELQCELGGTGLPHTLVVLNPKQ